MKDREKLIDILNRLDIVNHPTDGKEVFEVATDCFNDLYNYLEINKIDIK